MPIAKGWSTVKCFYREMLWDTAIVDPNAYQVPVQTVELTASRNMVDDPTMSDSREPTRKLYGNIDAGANILVTVAPQTIGFWLAHIIGLPTTTGSTAPYSHAFTPKALTSFVTELDMRTDVSNKVYRVPGCRIGSATFQVNQEGPVTLNMQASGAKLVEATTPLDATPSVPTHVPFGTEHVAVTIDTVSACGIKSLTLNFDNELDTSIYTLPCTGSTYGQRGELPEGRLMLNGSMELMFSTTAANLLTSALARGTVAIVITLTFGTGLGTTGNEKLTITMPKCDVGLFAPPINTRSGISVTIPFEMWKDSASAITATLLSPNAAAGLFISN
jgi:hypothetical protein